MKKVYLETFGCQMNVSDSERVATQLESEGYEMTPSEEAADIILFNTCSVREKAEHKLYTRVGQVRHKQKPDKLVGVMGCVAQLEGETLLQQDRGINFVVGTTALERVSDAIEKVSAKNINFADLGKRSDDYNWSTSATQRHSKSVAYVPIIEGCNKFCTYCIVPFSRGRERSLPASEIIREVLSLKRQGVKEIQLIGQNVNSYRPKTDSGLETFHGATPFSKLLRAVAATKIERIKFTTSFPRDFHPDIVDAIEENENLCNWVHLPVQSGSNDILKTMRRGHTIEKYKQKIDKIRLSSRNLSLTTDFIVGFPNETDEDFSETLKLAEYCQFDDAYIFKYSPRPGTPAHSLEDNVSAKTKKLRFFELEDTVNKSKKKQLEHNVGKTLSVLAEKIEKNKEDKLVGRSTCHKLVYFDGNKADVNIIANVKIEKAMRSTLIGKKV